ncbi:NitT/TauT family transport system permease protein [Leifsonia sp. 98AMF]|jgi:NitT/TauT family transport system permease protein|uniref:ABC transporter permease n=1 Tax=Microbacteriaceae TaxID=85023 RepID=UPI000377B095|nr:MULTISPECIES: ABC transporter permease [Microbacteriaceae]TDQ02544.1 NitT/TauT family transport system permease protein [Leifsonia sp. 115AMFTsu3.1]SDH11592.1 NitT/TauT family transport system permease protein [Leifsonia sp. 197AMF]SDJ27168.1 NitT/TauT family transport system permease protein [Leifsonia sp. 466MF]SDK54397.1 NitT/TauT family transport system permease protein [Leifsonia sp. 157MF]SDN49185.1 NitT/TauT family transport system permease protein [Leifsonia sp. 509MF]
MSVATERATVRPPLPDGVPAEPSRFSLKHPKSRLAWIRPAVWLPLVVMLALLAGLWQWGAASMPYLLPPLQAIGDSLAGNIGYYLGNALITLGEATAGLAIGFGAAFVVAVLISELPVARRAIMPIAVVLNVTPLVAIAPALVVAFGFGPLPKLIITALICFFPILINTAVGLRSVPQQVMQVYKTMDASRLEMLIHLRIPNALPYIFAALRIVFPLSIIGAVVAELSASGSTGGLGTAISVASSMNQLAVVYAAIFVLAVMGVLLLAFITLIERRVLHWHESSTD